MYDEITFFTSTSAFTSKVHTELVGIHRKFPDRLFANRRLKRDRPRENSVIKERFTLSIRQDFSL